MMNYDLGDKIFDENFIEQNLRKSEQNHNKIRVKNRIIH